MRRLGFLCVMVGCGGQPSGTAVRVTVTGNVPAFDHLAITLSADGTTRTPDAIVQSSIPPDIIFAVDVPRSVKGPLHVEVAAQDSANLTLIGAQGDAPLAPGEIRDLKLTLGSGGDGGGPTDDLSSGNDLSIPENADLSQGPPDLRPPVPMTVSLAGARPIPTNAVGGTRSFVDLNKDGKLDILDFTGSNWEVSLNKGNGAFGPVVQSTRTGVQPPIDLNNDGLADFVATTGISINVTLNDGTGVYPMPGVSSSTAGTCFNFQMVDLNRDMRPDLVCFESGGQFDVLLNDGAGAFPAAGVNYPTKGGTFSEMVDVNGDGAPDYVEASSPTDWHSFFNSGGGLFSPSPSPMGTAFNSVIPGNVQFNDLNGDMKPDGIIKNGSALSVALSNGDGTFATPTNSAVFTTISTLTLMDLNGDSKPDAVVSFNSTAELQVLVNNGSGVLGAPTTLPAGAAIFSYQVVDLNNDNRPDVAAVELGGTLDIFLNNGNGTFAVRVPYVVNPNNFQLLDLNKDGFLDVVTTTATSFGVLLNNKSGAFGTRHDTTTVSQPLFNDLTGDGAADAWGVGGANTSVWYSLNDAAGTFAAPVSAEMANLFTASPLAAADLNGDGRTDLIGGNSYIATTSGVPDLPAVVTTSATPIGGVVADVKPDGQPDIVFNISAPTVGAFLNMGGFTFSPQADYTVGANGFKIAAGHIKSPTSVDLVVANSSTNDVSVLINNGDGTFQSKSDYPLGTSSWAVGLADLNHDGYDDLAVGLNNANVGILLNNGSGIFSPLTPFAGTGNTDLLIADLNNDQRPELVISSNGPSTNQVSVLTNDGTGKFASKTDYTWTGVTVSAARLLDLTNDGQLDLIAAVNPPSTGKLTQRTNNGNGTFAMPTDIVTDGTKFAFGDLNRDGRVDLVTFFGSTLRVMIQDASGVFQPGSEYFMQTPTILEIADFDGDGLADVLCGGGIGTRFHILRNVSR